LRLLATCKLGQYGSVIEMDDKERARQLITKRVAEEVTEKVEKPKDRETKGGKKAKSANKDVETK